MRSYVQFFKSKGHNALVLLLLFFSGCTPYYKLVKSEFPQGSPYILDQSLIDQNIRNTKIYNQFSTELILDVLYFSPRMQEAYFDLFSLRHGYSTHHKRKFVSKKHHEWKNSLYFYVLAESATIEKAALDEKDAPWVFTLTLPDGTHLNPHTIKEIEFDPEICSFFGGKVSDFKRQFLITFNRKSEGDFYAEHMQGMMTLTVNSPQRSANISWNIISNNRNYVDTKKEHEDFYWV